MIDREYFTTAEYARLKGLSRSTVARLADQGRIPARRVGTHRRIFKTDLESAGLEGAAVPAAGRPGRPRRRDILEIADRIREVAARQGANNVRLFGSLARDEADEMSDVDLLVDLDPGRSLLDLIQLEVDLEELCGRRVDVGTARALRDDATATVTSDAITL